MQYGLLYQIFSSLGRALSVSVHRRGRGVDSVVLTVEPPAGDLVEQSARERNVYQYKARSDRRSWSLNEVIDKVLPDLYGAVSRVADVETRYWLVTEGAPGPWDEARRFFQRLRTLAPEGLPNVLDDVSLREFIPAHPHTDRAFFLEVARRATKGRETLDHKTLTRVQSLLSNFDVKTVDFSTVQEDVANLLLGFVEHYEKLPQAVDTLIGVLLRWGADGNRSFTVDELLRAGGLAPTSLALLPFARERIRSRLNAQLARSTYVRQAHVPRSVVWPQHQNVLCIVGESGMGKTGLLAQIADAAAESGAVVFWQPTRHSSDPLAGAADEVWRQILEHDQSLSLDAIARRAEALKLCEGQSWLTVCLDLTADAAYAAELVREEWRKWRIRVAFTAETSAATHVAELSEGDALVLAVGEFTPRQIREFFSRRGVDWRRIPQFVIEPLRKHPFLAHIYAELDEVATWRDTNEYALFREFWKRVTGAPGQHEHPNDIAALLKLAEVLLEAPDTGQWTASQLDELGIDNAARLRLQRLGWLRNHSDGRAEFMHQRLMNWAVAEAVVQRLKNGQWSPAETGAQLEAMLSRRDDVHRRFAFVPMDALSIALAAGIDTEQMATLLEAMESSGFYENLVPSLGAAAVPALLERLRRVERRGHARNGSVRASLLAIAEAGPLPPSVVVPMLNDPQTSVQRAGVELLKEHPVGDALEPLWRLRRELKNAASDEELIRHLDLEAVGDALEACVRIDPEWLSRKLQGEPAAEDTARLARLLATLANSIGERIWRESKHLILTKSDDDAVAVGAARCIGRYRDSSETSRMVRWIDERSPEVAEASFSALTVVDPSQAYSMLKDSSALKEIAHHWNPWWSRLTIYGPSEMGVIAVKAITEGSVLSRRMSLSDVVCGRITPAIFERVDLLIQKDSAADDAEVCNEIDHLMRLMARAYGLDVLRFLGNQSSTDAGSRLAMYASKRAAASKIQPDHFIEDASAVLLRIGGEPLQVFLRSQIARRDHGWFPRKIRAFQAAPSPEAERIVRDLLHEVWDTKRGEDDDWPVRSACIETLASMGDRRVVMQAEESGRLSFSSGFPRAMRHLPPADDAETSRLLLKAVRDEDAVPALRALAWSGRTDVVERLVDEALSSRADEIRDAARTALDYLPTGRMSRAQRERLREAGEHATYLDALFRDGSADALREAADYLLTLEADRWTLDDAHSAAWFVVYGGRSDLAPKVWQWSKSSSRHFWESDPTIWRAIGHVATDEAEDFLLAEAYSGKRGDINPVAIEALSYRQRDEAFTAAVHLFEGAHNGRASAPDLLVEIDRKRAIDVITECLIRERNVLIRTTSCIALRSEGDDLKSMAESWTDDPDPRKRAAGCELLGWLPPHDASCLRALALDDIDPMVQVFAADAVALQESQRVTSELLAALRSADGTAAWALTDVVLTSAHPLLLDRFDDPLALYRVLKGKSGFLRLHAEERLKKRVEEVEKKCDQPMRRDFYRR